LQQSTEIQLKRVEVDMNYVHLYFDEITHEQICFNIEVEENIEVTDPKPGLIHVYDYYDKEKSLTAQYSIRPICGTKEEIPLEPGSDEIDIDDPLMIEQRRVQPEFPGPEVHDEVNCPRCVSEVPEDLIESVCASNYAYKVSIRRGRRPLKVSTDLRPGGRGNSMNINAKFHMPNTCSCDILQNQGQKVLILTDNEVEITGNRKGMFNLGIADMVIGVEKMSHTEKQIRRQLKRNPC
jgi:hypothetical protein